MLILGPQGLTGLTGCSFVLWVLGNCTSQHWQNLSLSQPPGHIFFLEYQPFKYLLHFCNVLRCLVVENKNYAYSFLAEQQQFYRKKGKNLCNLIIFLLSSCLSYLLNICSNSQKISFKKKILSMIQKKYESCVKRSLMLQVSDNIWLPLLSTPCVCPVYFYFISIYFISFYFILNDCSNVGAIWECISN